MRKINVFTTVVLLAGTLLIGTGSSARAAEQACPDHFQLTSAAALDEQFPGKGVGDYARQKDKNEDGLICVKFHMYPPAAPYTIHITFVDNKEK